MLPIARPNLKTDTNVILILGILTCPTRGGLLQVVSFRFCIETIIQFFKAKDLTHAIQKTYQTPYV